MSEKTDKGYWITSAAEIRMDHIDSQLYRNDSVNDFLENKSFIIAEKGIGKTLLLKKKKYDLLNSKSGGHFIPSIHDLDIPADFNNLAKNEVSFLEQEQHTKSLWSLAIQLSVIKNYFDDNYEANIHESYKARLPDTFNNIYESQIGLSTPSEIFSKLIKNIPESLQHIKNYQSVINSLYTQIHFPIFIFIDRLDQAMLNNCTQKMWTAMQIGLLEAAWNLNENNNHIKIFCSIRKEAYTEYHSEIKGNLSGEVCCLNYREDELKELVNKLSRYYENRKTIEEIAGFGKDGNFINNITNNVETVFKYILRHTVSKPRDLIRIASTLKKKITPFAEEKERIKELRDAVNEAAEKLAEDIFAEKERFLDCLQYNTERDRFFSLIPKNILDQNTVDSICRKFNGKMPSECSREKCLKNKEESSCKHPFCELHNIGLFGYVKMDESIQIFKDPDADNINHLTGQYNYYIIHPSLFKIIERLRLNNGGKRYTLTPKITTGNGYKWEKKYSDISDLIDYVLNAELSEEIEKEKIQKLKDAIMDTENIKELANKFKKEIDTIAMEKKLFLSYCGKDEDIVNNIEKKLHDLGLKVTRDKRDLRYKANVKSFMKSLKIHGFVVTIISDSFLKSKNCMFEIGKLLEKRNYRSKTLQIILPDASIFDDHMKYEYIEYWKSQKKILENKIKENLSIENIEMIEEDIKDYDDIINNLPKFIEFVRSEKGMRLSELDDSGYKALLEHINKKKKNK
jgi:hypothetical protein